MEPRAEALYREATTRFAEMADGLQASLATMPELADLPRLGADTGLRTRARVYYTEMLPVAPWSARVLVLDVVGVRARRRRAIERDANRYLGRLLEVNRVRIKNDFEAGVTESRRLLESEIRSRLAELAVSAERALANARRILPDGAPAVRVEIERISRLRSEVEALRVERPAGPSPNTVPSRG